MSNKLTVDALNIKIAKVLLTAIGVYIIYVMLFLNLSETGFMQYLLIGGIGSCLIIAFIFIKETILGKIIYSILAVVIMLTLGWLTFMVLAQTAGRILSNF